MSITDRLMTAAVGAIVASLALTLALFLSFVAGPVGLAAGVLGLVGAPLLTLRVSAPFTRGGAFVSRRAVCGAIWVLLASRQSGRCSLAFQSPEEMLTMKRG